MKKRLLLSIIPLSISCLSAGREAPLNVLMIAVDDLNHWVDYTGRNGQSKTPNIARLSEMGVSFTNVHCMAPACNPSRASLMSGLRPSTSGCYVNGEDWKQFIDEGQGMEFHFQRNGYTTLAAGKIYHAVGQGNGYTAGWDEYAETQRDPQGGADKNEGFLDEVVTRLDDQDLADWHFVDYAIEQLQKDHDKPFFLACGLFKPHLAWAVPRKYYDMFPLDEIELPPHLEDDLDDIPPSGVKMARPDGDHAKLLASNRWKKAIQSYLACIAYTDMNIGRLLDAFEKSKYRDNTAIVLWSDHGWALGEKKHWRKFALWEETTRTIMIWSVPGVTRPGALCELPVDYSVMFPTMCDITGTPPPGHLEGMSIRPLLINPDASWDGVAVTTHGYMNHAVRTDRWRYIRYANGEEELYDHSKDEFEYRNLAMVPEYNNVKAQLARHLPEVNKPPLKK